MIYFATLKICPFLAVFKDTVNQFLSSVVFNEVHEFSLGVVDQFRQGAGLEDEEV